MGAVTYPHAGVERRLNDGFVLLRPELSQDDPLAKKYEVHWTPGLVILDSSESLHYRTFGYHPPELCEHLLDVARGMAHFDRGRYREAAEAFTRVAEDPRRSPFTAEALYWLGVTRYRAGEKEGLVRHWNSLLDQYPQSLWAQRVGFIRPGATAAA
jgi:tetratricopeptide (TPR) repeat protein